jgi:hypothetical protein
VRLRDLLAVALTLLEAATDAARVVTEWTVRNRTRRECLRSAPRALGITGFVRHAFQIADASQRAVLRVLPAAGWERFAVGVGLLPIPETGRERRRMALDFKRAVQRESKRDGAPVRSRPRRPAMPGRYVRIPVEITAKWAVTGNTVSIDLIHPSVNVVAREPPTGAD